MTDKYQKLLEHYQSAMEQKTQDEGNSADHLLQLEQEKENLQIMMEELKCREQEIEERCKNCELLMSENEQLYH